MNCTKIIPPSPFFINFYYYYSYFALFLSLSITPLLFYIILTQSKNLKSFKWLILNHSIWCLLFEILLTTVKPLNLPSAIAGFPLGMIRNGSLKITAWITYATFVLESISIFALLATLICRYMLVFPASNWLNKTRVLIFMGIILVFGIIGLFGLLYPFYSYDASDFHKMALSYDPCLQYYFSEPGFIYISHEISDTYLKILFSMLLVVLFLAICTIAYFIYLVKTHITATTTKLSNSLMISAIVQVSVTILFSIIPSIAYMGIYAFVLYHTQNCMVIICCLLCTHSFMEFFATIYFVTPYRQYLSQIVCIHFPNFGVISKSPTQVSHIMIART